MEAALSFTCVFVIFIFLFSLLFSSVWRRTARLQLDARALEAWDLGEQLLVLRQALALHSSFPFIKKCCSPYLMLSWILFSKLQKVNWISSREHAKDDCVPSSLPPLPPSPISYDVCSAFPWYFMFVLRRRWTTWFLRGLSLTLKKGWAQLLRLLWASPSLVLSFAGHLWAKLYLIFAFSHVY